MNIDTNEIGKDTEIGHRYMVIRNQDLRVISVGAAPAAGQEDVAAAVETQDIARHPHSTLVKNQWTGDDDGRLLAFGGLIVLW